MRKLRTLAVVAIGLGAALLLWRGRSTENAPAPDDPRETALPAHPASDPGLARTVSPRPELPGQGPAATASAADPDAWAGGRPIQRMRLPAMPAAGAANQAARPGPAMTPAEESEFHTAKHQALQRWSAAAQQAVNACVATAAPDQDAREPRPIPVDISFAPRAGAEPDARPEHVFVAEWLHASPPHLEALAAGRDRHVLEGCLARLQAIELHIAAAAPIGPDLRLAESIAIQM